MTYTQIGLVAVALAILMDLVVLRTQILQKAVWWVSYAIVISFQFITNGILTGFAIVQYDPAVTLGNSFHESTPPIFGDGRIFFAPAEDLLFGFAMCLLAVSFWIYFGRKGIGQQPVSNTSAKMRQRFKFLR